MAVAQHTTTHPLILNHFISSSPGQFGGGEVPRLWRAFCTFDLYSVLHKTGEWLTIRGTLLNLQQRRREEGEDTDREEGNKPDSGDRVL